MAKVRLQANSHNAGALWENNADTIERKLNHGRAHRSGQRSRCGKRVCRNQGEEEHRGGITVTKVFIDTEGRPRVGKSVGAFVTIDAPPDRKRPALPRKGGTGTERRAFGLTTELKKGDTVLIVGLGTGRSRRTPGPRRGGQGGRQPPRDPVPAKSGGRPRARLLHRPRRFGRHGDRNGRGGPRPGGKSAPRPG